MRLVMLSAFTLLCLTATIAQAGTPTSASPAVKQSSPQASSAKTAGKSLAKPAAKGSAHHAPATSHRAATRKPAHTAVHKPAHTTAHKQAPGAAAHKTGTTKPGAATSTTEHAEWMTNISDAFTRAKKQGKPILIDFYTDWCGWCKVMEHKTFEDPTVEKLLASKFITVRANAEDGAEGQKLATGIGIQAFPTTLILDSGGTPKALVEGFKEPDAFMTLLNDYLSGKLKPGGSG